MHKFFEKNTCHSCTGVGHWCTGFWKIHAIGAQVYATHAH